VRLGRRSLTSSAPAGGGPLRPPCSSDGGRRACSPMRARGAGVQSRERRTEACSQAAASLLLGNGGAWRSSWPRWQQRGSVTADEAPAVVLRWRRCYCSVTGSRGNLVVSRRDGNVQPRRRCRCSMGVARNREGIGGWGRKENESFLCNRWQWWVITPNSMRT
jgi:hypothetical protein